MGVIGLGVNTGTVSRTVPITLIGHVSHTCELRGPPLELRGAHSIPLSVPPVSFFVAAHQPSDPS